MELSWDDNKPREVEDAKRVYQHAKANGQRITLVSGEPVEVFKPSYLGLLIYPKDLRPGQLFLQVLDETGDRHLVWDSNDPDEVKEAAKLFKEYTDRGWRAYAVSDGGKRRRRIRAFHPSLEELEVDDSDAGSVGDRIKVTLQDFARSFSKVELLPKTTPG